ncbi:MAG: response regulator [Myxococcota bacterium]|nr:response regulator [Myxococcota bacterium]
MEQDNDKTTRPAGPQPEDEIFLVDDDERFAGRLARAFEDRGFRVRKSHSYAEAIAELEREPAAWAVVDLRLGDRSGLELIRDFLRLCPEAQIVMLTGYGSITTAVDAGRLGAVNYIAKPADADMVLAAFTKNPPGEPGLSSPEYAPPSLARTEWEHINRVLADCGGNISEAARKLGLHRRTLQRKLKAFPPDS